MSKPLKIRIEALVATALACLGLYFLARTDGKELICFRHFLILPGAVFLFFLYSKRLAKDFFTNRRKLIFSCIFAFALALSFILGYQMRINLMTSPGIKGKVGILLKSFFLAFAFLPVFESIFAVSDRKSNQTVKEEKGKWKRRTVFFLSWGIIFLCWIPVFFAYYPGIMSYDSNRQFTEAFIPVFWELQPIVHTLLIRAALLLGRAMGSYELGVACYTVLQMLVLSAALAFSLSFVYDLTKKRRIPVLCAFVFGIHPIFSVLALCVTKDLFFCAFFLVLFTLCLKRFLKKPRHPLLYDFSMLLCGVLMSLFRKNGIYGFALFAVLYVLAMKKERVRILILCILTLVAAYGSIRLVRFAVSGGPGPKTEMYAVPIQQMAKVAYYQRDLLTDEELKLLESYIDGCTTTDSFNISLADGPKYGAKAEAWGNTSRMLKDWAYFGRKYPNDYLDAYLGLTLGYWFTDDVSISQYLGYGRENRRGLIETFNASKPMDDLFEGVKDISYLPRLQYFLEGIVSDEQYLKWPVVSIFFRPAFYCHLMMLLFGILLYKKRYRAFAAASLQLTYFLTVLMGPVANLRYVFQIMIALPALWAFVSISLSAGKEDTSVLQSVKTEQASIQEEENK